LASISSDITLPKALKVRGRPKGAGQSVIGAKRKQMRMMAQKVRKQKTSVAGRD